MGKQVNMSDSCHKIFVGGLKKMAFPRGSRKNLWFIHVGLKETCLCINQNPLSFSKKEWLYYKLVMKRPDISYTHKHIS